MFEIARGPEFNSRLAPFDPSQDNDFFLPFFNTFCVLHGLVIVMAKFQLDQMTTGNVTAFFRIHGFRGLSRCMTTPVATTAQDTEHASR